MEQKLFITFVSHEMRSPLVVIRQYFESLKTLPGPLRPGDHGDHRALQQAPAES